MNFDHLILHRYRVFGFPMHLTKELYELQKQFSGLDLCLSAENKLVLLNNLLVLELQWEEAGIVKYNISQKLEKPLRSCMRSFNYKSDLL